MAIIDTNEILKPKDFLVKINDDSYQFNENFVRVGKESDDTWLYIDNGNLNKEVKYDILPRQKGKVIKLLIEEKLVNWSLSELKNMDTETVYEHLTSCYDVYSPNVQDTCYKLNVFLELCEVYGIKTLRNNYVEFIVYGYSQGDRVTILVDPIQAEKVWGNTIENGAVTNQGLQQLFYDSTNIVRIDVLGSEFISEQDGDYNYDKSDLIQEMIKYFKTEINNIDFFEEQLEEFLPNELSC